jgi:hypothetical protein
MPRRNLIRGNPSDLDQFHPTDVYLEVGHFQNPVVPVRSIMAGLPSRPIAQACRPSSSCGVSVRVSRPRYRRI